MTSRKDAIRAYKERTPNRGVYAVRCQATGQIWVGAAPDLDAAHNRIWFALRMGDQRNRTLQAAWQEHGEATFRYEVLERLADDVPPMAVSDSLKSLTGTWAARLGAPTLLP